ncbi:probable transcription factor PosF21 [Lycium ferocissimum]|uniref:probable transcription factor PosF21 n=1 Tax=Lycium ferocissimum TaxID=112874 RepID=UPI00281630F5|nr:probable transcription factor PosF21 [Lycium ferocissimum]XP_059298917.1 probable transcription factor PosF21 [Lycium ferocissimum]XP_059298918.1 probable transcription factor PosF21 [Lycium ferocissimum]
MDKDKSSLPPSGRYSLFSPPGSTSNVKSEQSGLPHLPPLGPPGNASESGHFGHGLSADSGRFSNDISRMPDNPPRKFGHRRAHSEILTLPDDISFDSDLGVVGLDGPSLSDETEEDILSMYLDMDKFNSSSLSSDFQVGESSSSAAAASGSSQTPAIASGTNKVAPTVSEKPRVRHQHSQSMDGSTTIKTEMLMSGVEDPSSAETKKATSAAKLAELALIDPKRAKRIWANRQSAARSKERKMRYIAELERKVQTLQTEATTLSAQLTLLQRDTNGLTAENSELKLRLQTMEQQVHLQDALNDALKEEIQHLKVLTGQGIANGGPMMNFPTSFGGNQQFYSNNQAMHTLLAAQQLQQLQIHSHKQQHQFQQHQLHQFQQQQLQHQQQQPLMQQQQEQLQQAGDMMSRSSMSSAQNDNTSDIAKD